jgi:3',5'-cyclic AMP phosphodiesterase CpdA
VVTDVTLLHLSDLHFGRDCELSMIDAVERLAPTLGATAIVVSGDLTQRARHGEFLGARRFLDRLGQSAPVLSLPGNHDVQWFESPFWILGRERMYVKYRRWFGQELTRTLVVPGAIIATMLTSHGVCFPSMTWNLNDMAVKGDLPLEEVERVARIFADAPPELARVVVLHQNVLRGKISRRMGLSRWHAAQQRLLKLDPDVILNGHDHEEAAAQLGHRVAVSTAGTLTHRMRGGKPSVFNVVRIEPLTVTIQHWRWNAGDADFAPSDKYVFARARGVKA